MVPHCGFDFHFSDNKWCWAYFHVFVSHLMSSFDKYLFSSLAHFLIGSFIFLVLSYIRCLHIFEINYLSVASFAIILSHSEGCLFILLIGFLLSLLLWQAYLPIMDWMFAILPKSIWWNSTVTDFLFLGSKITADGDCSHEIKRHLLLGRKAMTKLDSMLKSRDITLLKKVHLVKAMVFSVVVYGCESWTIKKAEHWKIDAFELWC